ncbi:hypothetical protein [Halohasta salina]|uniref:hypothetical protein n=1 Tax=Halohasta salina TaxID=2961621 RepID=UPI0020A5ED2E|nr:hypothetical protein [Halohasta salina]
MSAGIETCRAKAVGALAKRAYERAGDEYTRVGWQTLAAPREGMSGFEPDEKGWIGRGLSALAVAAVAYRVAGRADRATHRGVEGVAVAQDLTTTLAEPVQQACLAEFVADFRVVGGLSDAAAAYDDAAAAYAELGDDIDPQYWGTTPLFQAAAAPIKQAARSTDNGEIAVTWEALHGSDPAQPGAFLAHRARYKNQRFPMFVEQVVDKGYLAAPRGTTAYNTDQYRCPNCESADVNWIADSVLCLRCSTPMDE